MISKWLIRACMALSLAVNLISGVGRFGIVFLPFTLVALLAAWFWGWMERNFSLESEE